MGNPTTLVRSVEHCLVKLQGDGWLNEANDYAIEIVSVLYMFKFTEVILNEYFFGKNLQPFIMMYFLACKAKYSRKYSSKTFEFHRVFTFAQKCVPPSCMVKPFIAHIQGKTEYII